VPRGTRCYDRGGPPIGLAVRGQTPVPTYASPSSSPTASRVSPTPGFAILTPIWPRRPRSRATRSSPDGSSPCLVRSSTSESVAMTHGWSCRRRRSTVRSTRFAAIPMRCTSGLGAQSGGLYGESAVSVADRGDDLDVTRAGLHLYRAAHDRKGTVVLCRWSRAAFRGPLARGRPGDRGATWRPPRHRHGPRRRDHTHGSDTTVSTASESGVPATGGVA
jgi:hypothetical protein